ncbi:MAG: hypothetical protein EBT09_03020 [Actinobacteria bacterium]|nr:hypothetical protein [Actinomycetota bacterium]
MLPPATVMANTALLTPLVSALQQFVAAFHRAMYPTSTFPSGVHDDEFSTCENPPPAYITGD